MKRSIAYIGLFLLLLLSGTLSAQSGSHHHKDDGPAIKIKVTVDKQQILIGQPLQLMLEAFVPAGAPLTWPPLDTLPHFEWMEKGQLDSVIKPEERYYRQYFTITSFDSGSWAIPRLPFASGKKVYFSDSVRIAVGYSKFDPNQDFHDIKDIIDIPNPYAKWIPWGVAAITLLALALVVWLIRKKKLMLRTVAVPVIHLSPYEEAIRQLEELHKLGVGEDEQVKTYYTKLNDILRLFILRKLGIASLAETNEELIGQIRQLPLTRQQFDELSETLRMADFVKFAKYQPGTADNEHSYQVIRQSVDDLNAIGEEKEAAARETLPNTPPGRDNSPAPQKNKN